MSEQGKIQRDYTYNIQALTRQIWGVSGLRLFDHLNPVSSDTPVAKSILGTPVYDSIEVLPGLVKATREEYDGYKFPHEVLVECTLPKRIIETPIAGAYADGDVIEIISTGNWQLNIKLLVIDYSGDEVYPQAQVLELERILKLKTQLRIVSKILNLSGIDDIVITNIHKPVFEGYRNVQPYEIMAVSAMTVEARRRRE
jgi:phosphoribosylpyrophosphate synthetase